MITNSTSLPKAIRPYLCCVFAAGMLCTTSAAGGPTNAPAPAKSVEIAKSTFTMPRDKKEGRDPFYPGSTYPYEQSAAAKGGNKTQTAPAVDLKLTGIGGTPAARFATISSGSSSRTLGVGEDGEMTIGGNKVQLHVVEILESSVILTVNGEQRELRFRGIFNR